MIFLDQKRTSKGQIYSLCELEVECIRKEHTKYEFGNKISIARIKRELIVGDGSFKKEHDSKTTTEHWNRYKKTPVNFHLQ